MRAVSPNHIEAFLRQEKSWMGEPIGEIFTHVRVDRGDYSLSIGHEELRALRTGLRSCVDEALSAHDPKLTGREGETYQKEFDISGPVRQQVYTYPPCEDPALAAELGGIAAEAWKNHPQIPGVRYIPSDYSDFKFIPRAEPV